MQLLQNVHTHCRTLQKQPWNVAELIAQEADREEVAVGSTPLPVLPGVQPPIVSATSPADEPTRQQAERPQCQPDQQDAQRRPEQPLQHEQGKEGSEWWAA